MPHINVFDYAPLYILLAFVLIGLNAFFVAAEFALVKIRITRLEVLANRGHVLARMARKMVERLDPYLSATQLGITLTSLGLGWLGEPAFAHILVPFIKGLGGSFSDSTVHSISFASAFITISALHIILGELVPKSIAIQTAEKVCLAVVVPLRIFYIIFFPFLFVLNGLSNLCLKIIKVPLARGPGRAHSEEELRLVVEDSFEEGIIGPRKWKLLDKALAFSHKTISQIMVSENQIVYFNLDESVGENLQRVKDSGHTRYPLKYTKEGGLVGYVHMKDIIWNLEHGEIINLYDIKRPLLFFSSDKTIDVALIEFQKNKGHMALVEDTHKKVIGLVTLEDIIEELVGEIEDEFEKKKPKG